MGLKTTKLVPQDANVIQVPEHKIKHVNCKKFHPELYPHIKYIAISKTYQSSRPYKMRGYPTYTKYYGIGILTDNNEYYYNEITSRPSNLTMSLYALLKKIILVNYIIDSDTRVVLTDNIKVHSEGLGIFMDMLCGCHNILLTLRNLTKMTATINRMFRWVHPAKGRKFCGYHREKVIRKILELKKLDFITNPEWYINMELEPGKVKNAKLTCAIGILYLYAKDYMCNSVVNSPSYIQTKELKRIKKMITLKEDVEAAVKKMGL